MTLSRMVARPMLASMFVVGGANAIRQADVLAVKAKPVTDKLVVAARRAAPQLPVPSDAKTLVRANGALQVAGGLMLATGKAPRTSALVLLASLAPSTVSSHRFWEETSSPAKNAELASFAKNLTAGGGLLLAAVDTEGRPGLAWRARRAARDAKREARQSRRAGKRAAGAAKADRRSARRSRKADKRVVATRRGRRRAARAEVTYS